MFLSFLEWGRRAVFSAMAAVLLSSCGTITHDRNNPGEFPVVRGPSVADNRTLYEPAFSCVAELIPTVTDRVIAISVGNIRDYTGRFSESEGGNAITQGGSLMVISALGRLGSVIALRERFDTQVAELEAAYSNDRRLGDGQRHTVVTNGQEQTVSWLPELGGNVLRSDVYIVGGITELNYDVASGGFDVQVNQIGPRARTYVVNVAADLRLVNTQNLNVLRTVSLQKQVVGYEVEAGVFDFFGGTLVDIEAGAKSQEPLQLAVRTVLELATLDLISHIYSIDLENECLRGIEGHGPLVEEIVEEEDVVVGDEVIVEEEVTTAGEEPADIF